jgi:hypothetical protein
MEPRLDRADGRASVCRDAVEWHVLIEAQRNNLSLIGWKIVNGSTQSLCVLEIHETPFRIRVLLRRLHFDCRVRPCCSLLGDRCTSDGQPAGDPADPRAECAVPAVAREGPIRLYKSLLGNVLGLVGVAQNLCAESDHSARLALNQRPIGLAVARKHRVYELSIVRTRGDHGSTRLPRWTLNVEMLRVRRGRGNAPL